MKTTFLFLLAFVCMENITFCQSVGIGTLTPSERLHVVGNIKADTIKPNAMKLTPNAGVGKILTSDASGNAAWEKSSAIAGNIGFGSWGDCATNANIADYNPVSDSAGAANDYFGRSVSVSGNYALVGSPNDQVNGNSQQGSASFYEFDGNNWVQVQKVTDVNGASTDLFGTSVYILGNYAIIGIPYDNVGANSDQGSANLYRFNGNAWVFIQKITEAGGSPSDYFGYSVCLAGTTAIVGTPNDDVGGNLEQGSVNIYQFNGASWNFLQKITDVFGVAGDLFGFSVSAFGNRLIVGAPYDDFAPYNDQGSASIFNFNGTSWVEFVKLNDLGGDAGDHFGNSVSITENYAIIGAPSEQYDGNNLQGTVSIYQNLSVAWGLMQKIADGAGNAQDAFGSAVSITANYALVGAHSAGPLSQGTTIIYMRIGQLWQKLQYITDPSGESGDGFGSSVSLDESTKRFIIGAPYATSADIGKAVFGKIN